MNVYCFEDPIGVFFRRIRLIIQVVAFCCKALPILFFTVRFGRAVFCTLRFFGGCRRSRRNSINLTVLYFYFYLTGLRTIVVSVIY
ncbi:unnamed protein product [Moneuplotes crassus]|uniref:Uncharacterized protein n=1 Tax=Euplotes crassus TaxID=5936 RepID=A0AAD1Y5C4_EUPCR|nr:unnamed protein product [Moneuplotes crassus]